MINLHKFDSVCMMDARHEERRDALLPPQHEFFPSVRGSRSRFHPGSKKSMLHVQSLNPQAKT